MVKLKAFPSLSYYRKRKRISQEKLSELVGVSRQTVSRWEQGDSYPSADHLTKLSEVLDVPIDTLLQACISPPRGNTSEAKPSGARPPEPQIKEIPVEVPIEVLVPQPRNYRLLALLAALVLAAGIAIGVLFLRGKPEDTVLSTDLESEVIDESALGEPILLLPLE